MWPLKSPQTNKISEALILVSARCRFSKNRSFTLYQDQLVEHKPTELTQYVFIQVWWAWFICNTLNIKNFLHPLFCKQNSNTNHALVISFPEHLMSGIFSFNQPSRYTSPFHFLQTTNVNFMSRHYFNHFIWLTSQCNNILQTHSKILMW